VEVVESEFTPVTRSTVTKKNLQEHKCGKNILYKEGKGGEGVRQDSEKKKVSVGLFSTFRHPLATACVKFQ
jgi:hypothetical protein